MGRNFEFSRDEALSRAMQLFWQKGYRATSMKDIIEHTGLQPGSIYNSFGDKHSLFLAAVEYYGEVITARMLKVLEGDGSPLSNIRKFFINLINTPSHKKAMGCLLSNTVVELAPHEEDTARAVMYIMDRIETSFKDCLELAVKHKELSENTDTGALAAYLATCTHGLIVTGKTYDSKERMEGIVDVIMNNIR